MLHSRRLFLLLICCLMIFSLSQIAAQDETPTLTPTETSIPTLPPTETATDIPSATPLPSETPTALPTETPTPLPIPTASETPTETPTAEISNSPAPTLTVDASLSLSPSPTPTITLTPSATASAAATSVFPTAQPLTQLFSDNFDTGDVSHWTLGMGWGLIPSEGGQALQQMQSSNEPTTFVYNTLSDVFIQMRVLFTTGIFRLSMRESNEGAYTIFLNDQGQLNLLRGTTVIGNADIPSSSQLGTWQTVSLSILGDSLEVSINGVTLITVQDMAPLPSGTISFAAIESNTLIVDDVMVQVPETMLADTYSKSLPTKIGLTPLPTRPYPTAVAHINSKSDQEIASFTVGTVNFRSVTNVSELIDVFDTANHDPNNTYVVQLASGVYSFTNSQIFNGIETFSSLPVYGNIILVGLESYNLGIHPDTPTLPANRKVILERDINAPENDIFHIFEGGSLSIYNLVVRNGGGSTARYAGGGIVNDGYLFLYNSTIENNNARYAGGGIINNKYIENGVQYGLGTIRVINVVFRHNRTTATDSFATDGGGAIANRGGIVGGSFSDNGVTYFSGCVTFDTNTAIGGAFGGTGGAIVNGVFGAGGSVALEKVNFLNNTANSTSGRVIANQNTATTAITVDSYWLTYSSFSISGNVTISPAPRTSGDPIVLNCVVPPPPMPPRPPADITSEIPEPSAFHSLWKKFGLPPPFTSLPYVVSPNIACPVPGNSTLPCQPNNPLNQISVQGYGPSFHAYDVSSKDRVLIAGGDYGNSYQLHNGIDYGNGTWTQRVVTSICDGIVIPGNYYAGSNTGGSAQPGRGVAVRCFMDSLTNGNPDTDGDGKPNLSNVVVTYNHLLGDTNPALPNNVDCLLLSAPIDCKEQDAAEGQYLLAKYQATPSPGLPYTGYVVRVGTPLGQTGGDPNFDHLHMSVFLARGFDRTDNNGKAFGFNPYLMFSSGIADQHHFQTYFPSVWFQSAYYRKSEFRNSWYM